MVQHPAKRRHRKPPPAHPTEESKLLDQARHKSGLRATQIAENVAVHPRTLRRWEQGKTRPDKAEWTKLAAFYGKYVPEFAEKIAAAAGVPSPFAPPPPPDMQGVRAAIVRAADQLDVSPRRVRLAVREILRALATGRGTATDLWNEVEGVGADEAGHPVAVESAR